MGGGGGGLKPMSLEKQIEVKWPRAILRCVIHHEHPTGDLSKAHQRQARAQKPAPSCDPGPLS